MVAHFRSNNKKLFLSLAWSKKEPIEEIYSLGEIDSYIERNDNGTKWPDTLKITINYDTINNKQQRKIVPKDFLRLVWGENKGMRLSFV